MNQNAGCSALLRAGFPAAKGIQDKDPTIAELLKPYGYATGQIGSDLGLLHGPAVHRPVPRSRGR